MPAETTIYKIKYAISTDEVKAFPAEVSQPGAETIDKVLKEKLLIFKGYAAGATLKTGEFGSQSKAGETFTLPVATTANQVIGAVCNTTTCKVTTSGGAFVYGDFVEVSAKVATITLLANQHVVLQSDGTNWLIVAGEPKRESAYTFKGAATGEEVEPSATRSAFVSVTVTFKPNTTGIATLVAMGSEVGQVKQSKGLEESLKFVMVAEVIPGAKWLVTGSNIETINSRTLLR